MHKVCILNMWIWIHMVRKIHTSGKVKQPCKGTWAQFECHILWLRETHMYIEEFFRLLCTLIAMNPRASTFMYCILWLRWTNVCTQKYYTLMSTFMTIKLYVSCTIVFLHLNHQNANTWNSIRNSNRYETKIICNQDGQNSWAEIQVALSLGQLLLV